MIYYAYMCLFSVFYGHLRSFSDFYTLNTLKRGHLAHKWVKMTLKCGLCG